MSADSYNLPLFGSLFGSGKDAAGVGSDVSRDSKTSQDAAVLQKPVLQKAGLQNVMEAERSNSRPSNSHLQNLNPQQLEAVTHVDGPILILAGAGSGKTRVLTRRVAHLVLEHQVPPDGILAVTFTNKAADEMKHRLQELLGAEIARSIWVGTFHSICLRMLRRHAPEIGFTNNFVVADEDECLALIKRIMKLLNLDPEKFDAKRFRTLIDGAKNAFKTPQDIRAEYNGFSGGSLGAGGSKHFKHDVKEETYFPEVYEHYQQELHKGDAMDFGDLLMKTVQLLQQNPGVRALYNRHLQYVLVDEYQDTNHVQYMFVRLITEVRKNLLVVGDDDQSIYRFRGATIRNILEFERDYPNAKVVKLEQNYRSTQVILRAAYEVVRHNRGRKDKKIWTQGASGSPIVCYVGYTELDEARYIAQQIMGLQRRGYAFKDIAILYRTNAQSRALEEALSRGSIPYRIFGGLKFYDRKEIKDILAYTRLMVSPGDTGAFHRVINVPSRGVGPATIREISEIAEQQQCALVEAAARYCAGRTAKGVREFVQIISQGAKYLADTKPSLQDFIGWIVNQTQYKTKLLESSDPQAESRVENLKELQVAASYIERDAEGVEVGVPMVRAFLDKVALASSADTEAKPGSETFVSLMTLHLCKGLEFPVVFMSGMEDGLLPHSRANKLSDDIEEERRLCYVGITRAMQELYFTRAQSRGLASAGSSMGTGGEYRKPSPFLSDIPPECFAKGSAEFFETPFVVSLREDANSAAEFRNDYAFRERRPGGMSQGGQRMGAQRPRRRVAGGLANPSADAAEKSKTRTDVSNLQRASWQDLREGLAVVSPSLGKGVVKQVLGEGPEKGEVEVQFEHFSLPKKLLFNFAKLYLE